MAEQKRKYIGGREMSERPTPETDEAWDKYISFPYSNAAGDLRILAQKLEQERNEAITRRMETIMQCELYEQERDEARSERDHWKKIASAFEVLMPPVGGKRILKIIERDGWKCAYCGVETCFSGWDGPMPTVDHITPKAKGGLDHIANCVVACKDCNSAKSDQENWSPNTGEQKEKKTWAWEDGKFRKRNW